MTTLATTDVGDLDSFHYLKLNEEILKNPYPFFRLLREQAPVYREPDFGVYIVSRYEDIVSVHRRPEDFSSIDIGAAAFRGIPAAIDDLPDWRDHQEFSDRLITNDPPDHGRHRQLVNRLFTPRRIESLKPRIRELANELIDEFIDDGQVEFVSQYANLFPRMVVSELIGVPREDAARLKEHFQMRNAFLRDIQWNPKEDWERMLELMQSRQPANELERVMGVTEGQLVLDYFLEAVADRRRHPVDGEILSELVNTPFADGTEVPVNTIVMMVLLLYVAGGDANTTELLSNSLLVLLRHRQVEQELRDDPSLVEPFIEEVLRYDTPLLGVFRVARHDTIVGDVPVPKGAVVMVVHGAANHEPSHFPDADHFDLHRQSRQRHLSFGHGIHFCPGAPLARIEGQITTTEMLARIGNLRLAEDAQEITYMPSIIQRTPSKIQLVFDKLG